MQAGAGFSLWLRVLNLPNVSAGTGEAVTTGASQPFIHSYQAPCASLSCRESCWGFCDALGFALHPSSPIIFPCFLPFSRGLYYLLLTVFHIATIDIICV